MIITKEYIESLKTKNGGYTKDTLAKLGIKWPPKKGWKEKILSKEKGSLDD